MFVRANSHLYHPGTFPGVGGRRRTHSIWGFELELICRVLWHTRHSGNTPGRRFVASSDKPYLAIANALAADFENKFVPFPHIGIKIIVESKVACEVQRSSTLWHSQYSPLRRRCFKVQTPKIPGVEQQLWRTLFETRSYAPSIWFAFFFFYWCTCQVAARFKAGKFDNIYIS